MSNYVKIAEESGDRYLAALEKGQENYLKTVAAMMQWIPQPSGATPDISSLQAFSNAGFKFSEQVLEQQKTFATRLLAKPAKPAKPTQATQAAKATKVVQPARAAKAAKPAEAAKPAKLAQPAKPAKPAKPGRPARKAASAQPAQPAGKPARATVVTSSKKKPATRTGATPASKS